MKPKSLVYIKGEHTYAWLYRDGDHVSLFRALGRAAADERLSLTWQDVAVLVQVRLRGKVGEVKA